MRETWVPSLGREDLLEKEMATHSNTLAWKIPWTEEPGRLQSTGSQSWTRLSKFTSLHFSVLYTHTHTHIYMSISVFTFSWYIYRSEIAGSCGSSVFDFMGYLHTVFHNSRQIYFPTNSAQGSLFSISSPALVISCLLIMIILTGVRWYLVILMCISLIVSGAQYLFICFLAICKHCLSYPLGT